MTRLTTEQNVIKDLSEKFIEIQKPIRILDAIKWGDDIKEDFFKNKCKNLPKVDQNYYLDKKSSFDFKNKIAEIEDFELEIKNKLGTLGGLSNILQRMCREYKLVVRLLMNRGSNDFYKYSQMLYGSASDVFYPTGPTLFDLAKLLHITIPTLQDKLLSDIDIKKYSSNEAKVILNETLVDYFSLQKDVNFVTVSDQLVADAAAGAEVIKLREGAMFSDRDLRLLEVHEGWVHLGTTLNGLRQPVCTFLSKGPPSSTLTQEGLAVITEIFTFSSYPARLQRLTDRIVAINMAENDANFIDVFNYFLQENYDKDTAYHLTVRIFRGSLPEKVGPFTKDLSYSKGFVLIYNYIRLAIKHGALEQIPLLFLGKTTLEDLPVFVDLLNEGLIKKPKYLPPQFQDLAALSSWMSYSLFMNQLDLTKMVADYKAILRI